MSLYISNFWEEYDKAVQARKAGLEGRSRVCARRAAVHLVREYLHSENLDPGNINGFDLLIFLEKSSRDLHIKTTLGLYTEQVNVNYELPSKADLIGTLFDLAGYLNIPLEGGQTQSE